MYFMGGKSPKDVNSYCRKDCRNTMVDGKLQCQCGETDGSISWLWDVESCNSSTTVVGNGGRDVFFHPVFSTGTAVVRGSEMLEKNKHYYFEIKMLTRMYGTDIMIGVGTPKINLLEWKSKYCSTLGDNDQSWGYSYRGIIQHKGLKRSYGDKFSMGSLIGVHVDMCQGTLEYYLNRYPLGVAFTGLKNYDLYPMVSSTAAQSAIRLTCSAIFNDTLQFRCLREIGVNPDVIRVFRSIPGLPNLVRNDHFWLIPQIVEDNTSDQQKLELEDEAVIPLETLIKGKSLRKNGKLNKWGRYVLNDSEIVYKTAKMKREKEGRCYKNIVEKLKKSLLKEKRACDFCKLASCICGVKKDKLEQMEVKHDDEEVDFYGDIPDVRYCAKCNFRLGDHDVCKKDVLCSICDIIV